MRLQDFIPLSIRKFLGNKWSALNSWTTKKTSLWNLRGNAVSCNVCNWHGKAFADDHWHPGTVCPNCGSQVRHRLLTATLDGRCHSKELAESVLIAGKDIIHFAPERQLRERIQASSKTYVTADYDRGDCDLKLDMSSMPSITDGTFDIAIACDVLEHVPDDLAAMRELYRILRGGGTAVLSIPQMDPPSVTDSDPLITDPSERERRFGQKDHVRMYGDDFTDRLCEAGFTVTTVTEKDFEPDDVLRLGLTPPIPSNKKLATNFRRLYFAKK
jgi:SAM-dependent methyltransferase